MEDKLLLGKNIKNYRNKKNYSQEQLAEILNVSVSHISSWENAESYPSIKKLEEIANALDVKVYQLFMDDNDYDI